LPESGHGWAIYEYTPQLHSSASNRTNIRAPSTLHGLFAGPGFQS
jgi:hypothetical protein